MSEFCSRWFKTGYDSTVALKTKGAISFVMEVETRETERGTEIRIETEQKIALAVKSEGEERIYLPSSRSSDSSYYVEEVETLLRTEKGYKILHRGDVEEVEVIG